MDQRDTGQFRCRDQLGRMAEYPGPAPWRRSFQDETQCHAAWAVPANHIPGADPASDAARTQPHRAMICIVACCRQHISLAEGGLTVRHRISPQHRIPRPKQTEYQYRGGGSKIAHHMQGFVAPPPLFKNAPSGGGLRGVFGCCTPFVCESTSVVAKLVAGMHITTGSTFGGGGWGGVGI